MPIILGAFWVRSFPPHIDWLTLIVCGLPFCAALFVGWTSWAQMRALSSLKPNPYPRKRVQWISGVLAFAIFVAGWLAVEGTLRTYLSWTGVSKERLDSAWYGRSIDTFIYPARLSGANFADVPDDWVDRETFRRNFRAVWCDGQGISKGACGPVPGTETDPASPTSERLRAARRSLCADWQIDTSNSNACSKLFADLDKAFERDWLAQREFEESRLQSFDLQDADLRFASLAGAQLQGALLRAARLRGANLIGARLQGALLNGAQLQSAILTEAQLQGANLSRAQLQGANVVEAQLQGANLFRANLQRTNLGRAQFQGADLRGAQLQGTDLVEAQLQGASLFEAQLQGVDLAGAKMQRADLRDANLQGAKLFRAQLQGADLRRSQLQGAWLIEAQMQRADFRGVEFDFTTDLSSAIIRGAGLGSVENKTAAKLEPFWEYIFADGSVQVPEDRRPAHWEDGKLDSLAFLPAWRAWQRSIGQDPDNPE